MERLVTIPAPAFPPRITPAGYLVLVRRSALDVLRLSLASVQLAAPCRHDYPDAAAYERAEEVHRRRVCVLVGLMDELEAEIKELEK